MRAWSWWTGYCLAAVYGQATFSQSDFFSPGLIICLQHRQWKSFFWLAGVAILIQEGTGCLAFGASLLYYAGLVLFFFAWRWLLEDKNPLFVFLLAGLTGFWQYLVVLFLAGLQDLQPDFGWEQVGLQVAVIALVWTVVAPVYTRVVHVSS